MKKILLLCLAMCWLAAGAQITGPGNTLTFSPEATGPDTLYPPSMGMDCAKTSNDLTVLTLSSVDWIFGCNQYGDQEGAQVYNIGNYPNMVTGAICWIQKMGTAGIIYAKVYDVNEITNMPTTLLGTSDPLPNAHLPINPTSAQMASFTFSTPVPVNKKFAIAIEWVCEFTQGSAMGLASTEHECTIDHEKRSWILDSDGVWFSSQEYTQGGSPLLTDLYILPIMADQATGIPHAEQAGSIDIYPNPAHDMATISLNGLQPGQTSVKLYNTCGSCLAEHTKEFTSSGRQSEFNIRTTGMPNGIYLVVIANGEKQLSKKLVVNR